LRALASSWSLSSGRPKGRTRWLLAMTASMTQCSRGAMPPRFAFRSAQREGAGKTGCALHPRSHVQNSAKQNAHEHTGSAETLRPSLRNGFTAYTVLSPATNSSCHRHQRIWFVQARLGRRASANLTPATGARTTRLCRTLQRGSFACRRSLTGLSPTRPAITCHALRCRVHRIPLQRL
jgi:hypothetical protein